MVVFQLLCVSEGSACVVCVLRPFPVVYIYPSSLPPTSVRLYIVCINTGRCVRACAHVCVI